MNEIKRINIGINPSADAAKTALELSREISRYHNVFFVLGDFALPHITIYSPELPISNLEKAVEEVRDIASTKKPFKVKLSGYSEQRGFVFFDINRDEIMPLHKEVVERINPLREGYKREINQERNIAQEQMDNIEKYGHPHVMDLFNPHITISKLRDYRETEEAIANLVNEEIEFEVNNLTIFNMGHNGICTSIMEEIQF